MDVRILDEWGEASIGSIKIDFRHRQFNAHCCQLGQPGSVQNHTTPTMSECRTNRRAPSKPLGELVMWLRQSVAFPNHAYHLTSARIISRDDRRMCRRWLQEQAAVDPAILYLLQREAEFIGLEWTGVRTVEE